MIYRVSFYRKAEVVAGRAPRYMVDFEAETLEQAKSHFESQPGVIVRSVYKAPEKPIRTKPSYVFETSEDRNKWYSSHKTTQKERLCHQCGNKEVERYKRLCKECDAKRVEESKKKCAECSTPIPTSSRRRYCDACATKRKEAQEKLHREKRAKLHTIERIEEQIAWAADKLQTSQLDESCRLASRYQGLRIPHNDMLQPDPDCKKCKGSGVVLRKRNGQTTEQDCKCLHVVENERRCRACLRKFIDVQTVYLANIRAEGTTPPEKLME